MGDAQDSGGFPARDVLDGRFELRRARWASTTVHGTESVEVSRGVQTARRGIRRSRAQRRRGERDDDDGDDDGDARSARGDFAKVRAQRASVTANAAETEASTHLHRSLDRHGRRVVGDAHRKQRARYFKGVASQPLEQDAVRHRPARKHANGQLVWIRKQRRRRVAVLSRRTAAAAAAARALDAVGRRASRQGTIPAQSLVVVRSRAIDELVVRIRLLQRNDRILRRRRRRRRRRRGCIRARSPPRALRIWIFVKPSPRAWPPSTHSPPPDARSRVPSRRSFFIEITLFFVPRALAASRPIAAAFARSPRPARRRRRPHSPPRGCPRRSRPAKTRAPTRTAAPSSSPSTSSPPPPVPRTSSSATPRRRAPSTARAAAAPSSRASIEGRWTSTRTARRSRRARGRWMGRTERAREDAARGRRTTAWRGR